MAWVRTVVIQGFISMSNVWTPHDLMHMRALDSPEPQVPGWNSRCTAEPTLQRQIPVLLLGSWRSWRAVVAPRRWWERCVALTGTFWEVIPWKSQAIEVVLEELLLVPLVWFWSHCPAFLAACVPVPESAPAVCLQGSRPWYLQSPKCSGIFVFPAEGHWVLSVLVPYQVNNFASEKSEGRMWEDLLLLGQSGIFPECLGIGD